MVSVFLFVPNLIGYIRVISAALAFYYIDSFVLFFIFYSISAWLDIADGYAARALNQKSKFGAVLDMVTDRASTSCLIVVLTTYYPTYLPFFLFMIALDIMSHIAHINSSLLRGVGHKVVNLKQHWLIRLYYTSRLVLGFLCFGNEGFFVALYVQHFTNAALIPCGPLAPVCVQVFGTPVLGWVTAVAFFFFFPIMAVKQFINCVQLYQASVDIVEIDENDILLLKQK